MNFKVHNTAIIDKGAKIGKDLKSGIGPCMLRSKNWQECSFRTKRTSWAIMGKLEIIVKYKTMFQSMIMSLEDAVFCGPSVVFTNVYNPDH